MVVTASDATMAAIGTTVRTAEYTGGDAMGGYSVTPALPDGLTVDEFLSATYYDDYSFVAPGSYLGFKYDANIKAFTAPVATKGRVTGSYASPGITTAMYYDPRTGNVAQTAVSYPLNYCQRTTVAFDNRGNMLIEADSLKLASADTTIVKISRYQYDNLGNPTTGTVELNGKMATIATEYNAEGRALCRGRRATRTGDYALPRLFARWRIATRPRFHLAGARQNGPTSAKSLGELACARFGARLHNAARCSFDRPDPLAEKYYAINPYVYCAADPINHIDPTGCFIIDASKEEWESQKERIKATLKALNGYLKNGASNKSKSEAMEKFEKNLKARVSSLNSTLATMSKMESSRQGYALNSGTPIGDFSYNTTSKLITLSYKDTYNFVHEVTHAGQFEDGKIAFNSVTGAPEFYDIIDEVEAYHAQYAYDPVTVEKTLGVKLNGIENISSILVQNIQDGTGVKPYYPGNNDSLGMFYVNTNATAKQINKSYPWIPIPSGVKGSTPYIMYTPIHSIGSIYKQKWDRF